MQELEQKLKELEIARSCCRRCNEQIKKEMENLDTEEYSKKEMILKNNIEELKIINEKVYIINEAMDILEGIGGE